MLRDDQELVIPAEEVINGDTLIVKAGESIPVNGVLLEGHGSVDESALTGGSISVDKAVGDRLIGATINQSGYFTMRADKVGDETALAQIIQLVDEATSSKAPIAKLADKVAGVFVPIVIAIAVLSAIVWLLVGASFEFALTIAVSVLSFPTLVRWAWPPRPPSWSVPFAAPRTASSLNLLKRLRPLTPWMLSSWIRQAPSPRANQW